MNNKGDGKPKLNAHRWLMRMGNGQEFVTRGYYTREEVEAWECSKPVRIYYGHSQSTGPLEE